MTRVLIFHVWLLTAIAAGGTYLAHDRHMAFAALVIYSVFLTVLIRDDRREWDGR